MAQPKTIFDDTDEAIEEAAVAKARAEIAAGKGVSHEEVGERLQRLAAGESVPPPTPD
jgi:predicted transcriptional regulator